MDMTINNLYYQLKPLIPRRIQILLRRKVVNAKRKKCANIWPILHSVNGRPKGFPGWPGQKRFALILTHDVDTAYGQEKCIQLMKLEERLGFRSSFNFVPERYKVSERIRKQLSEHDFEVGVHGLNHDGKLFRSKSIFQSRSKKINHYIKLWGAKGFRAPAMHHNLDWIHLLNIEYDASTFDTDPFEPQSDGCGKIYPYWVSSNLRNKGYVELPYTLPQDFTVFILMRDYKFGIWKKKLDWLVRQGGMALLNTHPDYMSFERNSGGLEEYYVEIYQKFLKYIKEEYSGQCWHVKPKEIAKYWRETVVCKKVNKESM